MHGTHVYVFLNNCVDLLVNVFLQVLTEQVQTSRCTRYGAGPAQQAVLTHVQQAYVTLKKFNTFLSECPN